MEYFQGDSFNLVASFLCAWHDEPEDKEKAPNKRKSYKESLLSNRDFYDGDRHLE